jgi:hypothetical protein
MENETLIIHKTCKVYYLWFFEELRKEEEEDRKESGKKKITNLPKFQTAIFLLILI